MGYQPAGRTFERRPRSYRRSRKRHLVSAAVAWEIVIKHAGGKLELPLAPAIYVSSRLRANGYRELPIAQEHALAVASLPAIHADPFDRIMIAQAQCASMTLVTRDARSLRYPGLKIEA